MQVVTIIRHRPRRRNIMNQRTLSNWLKGIVIGLGICGIFLFAVLLPYLVHGEIEASPELSRTFITWMITIWVLGIACYAVLVFCWKIAANIGRDNSFCDENAHLLKLISVMAVIDCVILFVANVVYLFLNISHPGIFIASMFVIFIGIAIAVTTAALSHLVLKAALLQKQSDLTI